MKNSKRSILKKVLFVTIFIELSFYMIIAMISYSNGNKGISPEKWKIIVLISIILLPVIAKQYYQIFKEEARNKNKN